MIPKASLSDSATADEVRTYIIQALVTKHAVTVDFATKQAANWDIGRGSELRAATLDHLQRVFDDNVGLCLHRAIREDEVTPGPEAQTPLIQISKYAAIAASMGIVIILACLFLPELGLQSARNRVIWASYSVPWPIFAACATNYAYQRPVQDSIATLSWYIAGAMGWMMAIELAAKNATRGTW
ncbi:hypothetical protein ASPACDRAFT_61600 [Aspergillus aculeatus ATCC 16872]|uniref:Uncharacterized protein n=1 Tax=Aspergillus aculeatus (strain ATCC 16872 / CBS 172.66 / WB 5094) TaxID=690307 RepID=A0A1L9WRS8_ASPA1|nr:uncharacterized protein ASPACDRAFT_61600 [Aspergillus aculeatus ATCC 16872]OJJ98905.1 hypothetical protein ASPACDRAFT_61600 [Aspergillus aculeatus ATCC 16872]